AMAHVLVAYLHLMSTDVPDLDNARAASAALGTVATNEREAMHAAAIAAWLDGDWTGAARQLDDLLLRWPKDLLALMLGHQLDFFLGDAGNLCDRPARTIGEFAPDHPHAGFVRGMQSFGFEESGFYPQAEAAGLAALEANPDDVWAVHGVVHTLEMQGRIDEGIRFMQSRVGDWGAGNLFTVHNWWHLALYCLEAGDRRRALQIYDAEVHHPGSLGVPIEMLDASALLWRFELDGADTEGRFAPLADAWASRVTADPWYAFNDLHAVMAFVGAGRLDDAKAVVRRLDTSLESASGTNARMTAEIGRSTCRAVIAFAEGRYADAIGDLAPIRRIVNRFGGSHAQRDALQRTLLESALRAGHHELARALLAERLNLRDTSVYSWSQQARLHAALGATEASAVATDRATALRAAFAAALTSA
ncbi:MAG: tetratricopeptide repeat protein, partial [Acidimicrobiia bacterium]